jgi:flavodoxin
MVINSVRLLYFSPTGTTRKVLGAISEGLGVDISISLRPGQERDGVEKYRAT